MNLRLSRRLASARLAIGIALCMTVCCGFTPEGLLPAQPDRTSSEGSKEIAFVFNSVVARDKAGAGWASVLEAATQLVGGRAEQVFDAGKAHAAAFGAALEVDGPSEEATAKARWLRRWLHERLPPGGTIVLLGDETALPTWRVSYGATLTSDSFYCDLDGDGLPETAVCRVIGSPDLMVRQLRGKRHPGRGAAILCSEDTRIHLETRAFAHSLGSRGYKVEIRGARDDKALTSADVIVHFGHGSPEGISNRFGETFVSADSMPGLPRSPIVFVDGCGTLPVGSPLLRAFLEKGAIAYVGSTETVQGMIPARYTNELVEHFLRILEKEPGKTLPRVLTAARAAYIRGHLGLAATLRELADTGHIVARGDDSTHVLTVAEWVYYGDPRATFAPPRRAKTLSRQVASVVEPVQLAPGRRGWQAEFLRKAHDGQAVLSLYADMPLQERQHFALSILQNDQEIALLDGGQDTVYQRLGHVCRGGHASGDRYRARFLQPLEPGTGRQRLEVRLREGSSVVLTAGTGVDIWPLDFEKRIALRHAPATRRGEARPRKPVKAVGNVKIVPTGKRGFAALDLSTLFNRPHHSMQLGGGDNASFKTWFTAERVSAAGVPFRVRRRGDDVLVSENNTQNVFELSGFRAAAKALHFLIWGYNRPRQPARLRLTYDDGTTQDCELQLAEWTEGAADAAFDFQNTVRGFHHAAVFKRTVSVTQPEKPIVQISSSDGTYGLIAITIEK